MGEKTKMSKFFILAMLVLAVPLANASIPSYDVQIDFSEEVVNGNQDFGEILLIKKQPTAEIVNVTNFTVYNAETFDVMTWGGNITLSMKLNNIFLGFVQPGGNFTFGANGVYIFESSADPNLTGTIGVVSPPDSVIDLVLTGTPIVYNFSIDPVTLDTQEKVIDVSAFVHEDVVVGPYTWTLITTSDNSSKNFTGNTTLIENKLWDITEVTVVRPYKIKSGTTEAMGDIKIINLGNVDFVVSLDILGDGKDFISVQRNQTLFKESTSAFNLISQIPARTPFGLYNVSIILTAGNISKLVSFDIEVTDTDAPEIKRVTFKDEFVHHSNEIIAEVVDNIDVQEVQVTFDGETHNMTRDQQLFIHPFTPTELKEYIFDICAVDVSTNRVCQQVNKSFSKLDIIQYSPALTMPSRKTGAFASNVLFTFTEKPPSPITVRLVSFSSEEANKTVGGNYNVRLIDADGTVLDISSVGQGVQVQHAGQIRIDVSGDSIAAYDIVMEIVSAEYMVNISSPIHVTGRFLGYDVPSPFSIPNWYGNKSFECDVVDTGNLESSFYDCKVRFPIHIDVKQLAIPTTVEEKELEEQNHQLEVDSWTKKVSTRNYAISGLIGLLFFVICWMVWGAKIHPYFRWRTKG